MLLQGLLEGQQLLAETTRPWCNLLFSFFVTVVCFFCVFFAWSRAAFGSAVVLKLVRERKLGPYVGSGPAGTGPLPPTGRGRDLPSKYPGILPIAQLQLETKPNCKVGQKVYVQPVEKSIGHPTNAAPQPDTRRWKFPNGQRAPSQSLVGGFHEERRLQRAAAPLPPTSTHEHRES